MVVGTQGRIAVAVLVPYWPVSGLVTMTAPVLVVSWMLPVGAMVPMGATTAPVRLSVTPDCRLFCASSTV